MTNKIVEKKPEFKTKLIKYQDNYMSMVEQQCFDHGIHLDEYQKTCARNALTTMAEALKAKGLEFANPELDQSSVTGILQMVSTLRLNASAMPNEIYFTIRNFKKHDGGWGKRIEMGIEGDGNDALLRNFGVNVAKVGSPWLVREDDEFHYPEYSGFDVSAPKWKRGGHGKIVRVVYPLLLTDGSTEFLISERFDVLPNLLAHINNNMMNETFGIAKDRYNATEKQKSEIDAKKKEVLNIARSYDELDGILNDPALDQFISPAWKGDNREQMIIRKMRNNAVKKYPKNFGTAFAAANYAHTDENYQTMQEAVDNERPAIIDITPIDEETSSQEVELIAEPIETPLPDEQQIQTNDQPEPPEFLEVMPIDMMQPGF